MSVSHSNVPVMPASLLGLFAFGTGMAFVDRNLSAVVAPLLKADLGLSDTQLGLLDGPSFALLYVAGVLASWPLAYSPRRLRVLAVCAAMWMLGMVLFASGHSFMTLVAGRALVGLGQSIFLPLTMGLVAIHAAPPWRARSIAALTASSVVGRSFSLLLGGALLALFATWLPASTTMHWRLLFLIMAAPNLLLIIWLARHEELPLASSRPAHVFRSMFAAMREQPWSMGAYLCGASASVLVVRTLGAWAPSVLHREQGLTPAAAALVFGAATLVASPLGHALAGILVDKGGEKRSSMVIVAGALLLSMPMLAAMPWADSAMAACMLLALTSLTSGAAVVAALSGWPALLNPSLRDMGMRVFIAFIAITGETFGPWMAGAVSDGLGMGGHGLSLALCRVCTAAATIGIASALLARTNWRRGTLEAAR